MVKSCGQMYSYIYRLVKDTRPPLARSLRCCGTRGGSLSHFSGHQGRAASEIVRFVSFSTPQCPTPRARPAGGARAVYAAKVWRRGGVGSVSVLCRWRHLHLARVCHLHVHVLVEVGLYLVDVGYLLSHGGVEVHGLRHLGFSLRGGPYELFYFFGCHKIGFGYAVCCFRFIICSRRRPLPPPAPQGC